MFSLQVVKQVSYSFLPIQTAEKEEEIEKKVKKKREISSNNIKKLEGIFFAITVISL